MDFQNTFKIIKVKTFKRKKTIQEICITNYIKQQKLSRFKFFKKTKLKKLKMFWGPSKFTLRDFFKFLKKKKNSLKVIKPCYTPKNPIQKNIWRKKIYLDLNPFRKIKPIKSFFFKTETKPHTRWPDFYIPACNDTHDDSCIVWKLSDNIRKYFFPTPEILFEMRVLQKKRNFLNISFISLENIIVKKQQSIRPLTITNITTQQVISAAGLMPNLRHASISQVLTARAIRRFLIVFGQINWSLYLRGVVPGFLFFWKIINSAASELYKNPINEDWIVDIGLQNNLQKHSKKKLNNQLQTAITMAATLEEPENIKEKEFNLAIKETEEFFTNLFLKKLPRNITRYKFFWKEVYIVAKVPHGLVKKKKARSIKKRLAKRLTATAKRRFWIL